MQRHDVDICDPSRTRLGIVFNLMLLFVEIVFPEKIVDGFVILRVWSETLGYGMKQKRTYDFEELAFHLVFPTFELHVFGNTENLLNCARDHPRRFFVLPSPSAGQSFGRRKGIQNHPPL